MDDQDHNKQKIIIFVFIIINIVLINTMMNILIMRNETGAWLLHTVGREINDLGRKTRAAVLLFIAIIIIIVIIIIMNGLGYDTRAIFIRTAKKNS